MSSYGASLDFKFFSSLKITELSPYEKLLYGEWQIYLMNANFI